MSGSTLTEEARETVLRNPPLVMAAGEWRKVGGVINKRVKGTPATPMADALRSYLASSTVDQGR